MSGRRTPSTSSKKTMYGRTVERLLTTLRTAGEAYGSIGDQLDMQFHDSVNGTTTWQDHVAAVKAKYQKP
tara:strand:- start:107 stop:316 length:210 start_codon:yes stop_codon:yes gene_type:complete